MYCDRISSAQFFCDQQQEEFLCRKRRKSFFVTAMNYCCCSNWTMLHFLNKARRKRKNSSMKSMMSMNSWITMIFGTERVIHLFIEIIHFTDEKEKKNMICIVDKITLYRDRVEGWLIVLCICCLIFYKWDYFFVDCY